ncbi:hypothetical protein [Halalkalicoccus tibetensis]|uniref:Uncharacterized protein n=1 Tax=Halalkalicoccus tibetensis TaxID=175632 RepID=A0ABD5VBZ7_9EURY
MPQSTRSDGWKLRELERQLAAQRCRLDRFERVGRQLMAAPALEYEWRCDHCRSGWIVHDGDELRCTGCGYLQYL